MWPQAIIHTNAQYTYVHPQYSLIVWGLLRLTPIKKVQAIVGGRQRTIMQTCKWSKFPDLVM